MCPYLEDLSGIPKIVNGDLKLQLHDTTYVNKMPEHIRNLYIGDGFFNLSKETIDLLPYDIQYIKVRMFNKTDYNPEIIKLLKSHVSASIDIIK